MKSKSIGLPLGLAALIFLLYACSRPGNDPATNAAGQKRPSESERAVSVASIRVQEVQRAPLELSTQATCVLRSRHHIPLTAEVNGRIIEKRHEIGDALSAGEAILLLDPEPYELAQQQARAGLASAQVAHEQALRNYQRSDRLRSSDDISQFELENALLAQKTAQAGLQSAEAACKMAERNLRLTQMTSPINGHLADLDAQIGQQVTPGTPLGLIVALDQMEIEVGLSEREIGYIELGNEARIRTENFPDRVFSGKVRHLGVAGLEPEKSFPVIVAVNNAAGYLYPGMSAQVELIYGRHDDAICVPRSALIMSRENQPTLFVVENEVARRRSVTLGRGDAERVIIESGLTAGEKLVIEGQNSLHDSVRVKIL